MTYGPFHTLRCKDDIAAQLLDGSDDAQSPAPAESSDRPDSQDAESGPPSFLSADDSGATPLTGPAATDDR